MSDNTYKTTQNLTTAQKKFLRGVAHNLNPMIMIGANGVNEGVLKELESTLQHHELLKIKLASSDRNERKTIIASLLNQTNATLVHSIGKTCVIFRQKVKNSNFDLT